MRFPNSSILLCRQSVLLRTWNAQRASIIHSQPASSFSAIHDGLRQSKMSGGKSSKPVSPWQQRGSMAARRKEQTKPEFKIKRGKKDVTYTGPEPPSRRARFNDPKYDFVTQMERGSKSRSPNGPMTAESFMDDFDSSPGDLRGSKQKGRAPQSAGRVSNSSRQPSSGGHSQDASKKSIKSRDDEAMFSFGSSRDRFSRNGSGSGFSANTGKSTNSKPDIRKRDNDETMFSLGSGRDRSSRDRDGNGFSADAGRSTNSFRDTRKRDDDEPPFSRGSTRDRFSRDRDGNGFSANAGRSTNSATGNGFSADAGRSTNSFPDIRKRDDYEPPFSRGSSRDRFSRDRDGNGFSANAGRSTNSATGNGFSVDAGRSTNSFPDIRKRNDDEPPFSRDRFSRDGPWKDSNASTRTPTRSSEVVFRPKGTLNESPMVKTEAPGGDPESEASGFFNEEQESLRSDGPIRIPRTTAASQFLYGRSVVEAALKVARRKLYKLYIYNGDGRKNEMEDRALEKLAELQKVRIVKVPNENLRMMDKMSDGRPHNGHILEASPLPQLPLKSLGAFTAEESGFRVELEHQSKEDEAINGKADFIKHHSFDDRKPFVLLLDGILDPGNLGAILRTAAFLGINNIAITKHSSATLTSVALKASSGASETLNLFSIDSSLDFLNRSRENGWLVYAAVPSARPSRGNSHLTIDRIDSYDPLAAQPTILVIGSEGKGISKQTRRTADYEVSIPSLAEPSQVVIDSLNVSVATGILCAAFVKKQSSNSPFPAKKEPSETDLW